MGGIGAAWNDLNDIELLISPADSVPAIEFARLKDQILPDVLDWDYWPE